ncbi:MAG: hypothetical protein IPN34_21180 [Planctomycetes bacterium]|nr:hypothetical protein [Planctomycetota bacterium]
MRARFKDKKMRPRNAFQRHLEQLGDEGFVLWKKLDGRNVLILAPFART